MKGEEKIVLDSSEAVEIEVKQALCLLISSVKNKMNIREDQSFKKVLTEKGFYKKPNCFTCDMFDICKHPYKNTIKKRISPYIT